MQLIQCSQCGNQFSPEFDQCPKCGTPVAKDEADYRMNLMLGAGMIVMAVVYYLISK